jgi:hypothetical protein
MPIGEESGVIVYHGQYVEHGATGGLGKGRVYDESR